jgi:hypothetical protein
MRAGSHADDDASFGEQIERSERLRQRDRVTKHR